MKNEIQDWELTAFALGELDGDDKARVAAHLMRAPRDRAQVDEVRALQQRLAGARPFEEVLSAEALHKIQDRAPAQSAGNRKLLRWGSIAASLVFVGTGAALWSVTRKGDSEPAPTPEVVAQIRPTAGLDAPSPKLGRRSDKAKTQQPIMPTGRETLGKTEGALSASGQSGAKSARAAQTGHRGGFYKSGGAVGYADGNARLEERREQIAMLGDVAAKDSSDAARDRGEFFGTETVPDAEKVAVRGKGADDFDGVGRTETQSPDGLLASRTGALVSRDRIVGRGRSKRATTRRRWRRPARFVPVSLRPRSTFAIDVDTASFANVRSHLRRGRLPSVSAVRIEEMVNYFEYELPEPLAGRPLSLHAEVGDAPWHSEHLLARVALKGKGAPMRLRANLVFLIDVSGSMASRRKLPLLKRALRRLVRDLEPEDRISIVTYAGAAKTALAPTRGTERKRILRAISRLRVGGYTNGSAGIDRAYREARSGFISGGINRVILASDGDFNMGLTSHQALQTMIQRQALSGVFLTVLGFGRNFDDRTLELLANKGNGHYAYIDDDQEAERTLFKQLKGSLQVVAKDVKLQVEFNPARVQAYRLLGYENRAMRARDFRNDAKDGGELGAGQAVTALYELIPIHRAAPLKYGPQPRTPPQTGSDDLFTVQVRYKSPQAEYGETSQLIEKSINLEQDHLQGRGHELRFAAAVAGLGLLLRNEQPGPLFDFEEVVRLAQTATRGQPEREAFVKMAKRAARRF